MRFRACRHANSLQKSLARWETNNQSLISHARPAFEGAKPRDRGSEPHEANISYDITEDFLPHSNNTPPIRDKDDSRANEHQCPKRLRLVFHTDPVSRLIVGFEVEAFADA